MVIQLFLIAWPYACLENVQRVEEEDLDAFPKGQQLFQMRGDAIAHHEESVRQRDLRLSPWIDWNQIAHDAECDRAAYEWLHEAEMSRGSSWSVGYTLQCLSELRRVIGLEAYYRGRMPTPQTWTRGLSYVPCSEPDP